MSIEAITWALENADIPSPTPTGMPSAPALTVVLLGLASHASRHGRDAFPSVRTLAHYARLSERQVQRCLSALVQLGLIRLGDQSRVAATITREDRRPTNYDLTMAPGDSSSPRPPRRGDTRAPHGVTARHGRGDAHVTRAVLEPRNEPAARRPAIRPPLHTTRPAKRQHHPQIEKLADACRSAGLFAGFDTLTSEKATTVARLVDVHGIDALVRAALDRHRPEDPARSAAAWISTWQNLQPPRPKLPPRCGRCDEYGWLPDDDFGRAVRCPCRRPTSSRPALSTEAEYRTSRGPQPDRYRTLVGSQSS